jgi:hypothetical protein
MIKSMMMTVLICLQMVQQQAAGEAHAGPSKAAASMEASRVRFVFCPLDRFLFMQITLLSEQAQQSRQLRPKPTLLTYKASLQS